MQRCYGTDSVISYTEYLAEHMHLATQYSNYLAEEVSINGYEEHYSSGVHVPNPYASGPHLLPLFTYDLVADPGFSGAVLHKPLVPDPNNPFDCDDD